MRREDDRNLFDDTFAAWNLVKQTQKIQNHQPITDRLLRGKEMLLSDPVEAYKNFKRAVAIFNKTTAKQGLDANNFQVKESRVLLTRLAIAYERKAANGKEQPVLN